MMTRAACLGVALAIAAGCSVGPALATATPAAVVVRATPAASAATATTAARPRHRRRRARPRAARAARVRGARVVSARVTPSLPSLPARPAPRDSHRRAALPHATRLVDHHSSSKGSSRRALDAPATNRLLSLRVAPLQPEQNQAVSQPDRPMTSGRGPPRVSPSSSRPAARPTPPPPAVTRLSALPVSFPSLLKSDDPRPPALCGTRELVASFHTSSVTERPPCRFHADRREGTAARDESPSIGGLS